jgi:hypothetical protein
MMRSRWTDTILFLGPSLPAAAAAAIIPAVLRPPARMGDVYRVVRDGARFVGIVDGYYESVPAVWHKEILWALGSGVRVFGAASMGALRAAELDRFGMIGVGEVYRRYRDGELCDDDEVALLHAPAAGGYAAASVPMVTIRVTLEAAVAEGLLGRDQMAAAVAELKARHYPERDWPAVLSAFDRLDHTGALRRLAAWLPDNIIDVKRRDAHEMVALVAAVRGGTAVVPPAPTPPPFEPTWIWQELALTADAGDRSGRHD